MPNRRELTEALEAAEGRIHAIMTAAQLRARTPAEYEECEAARAECDRLEAEIAALDSNHPPASSEAREQSRDSMRRTLRAQGLTPREDPGAGLAPAQASMARLIAQSGR